MAARRELANALRGRAPILALGAFYVLGAISLMYLESARGTPVANAFLLSLFAGVPGLILLYGGYRLPNAAIDPRFYPTISSWSFGAVIFVGGLLTAYHFLPPISIDNLERAMLVITGFVLVPAFAGGINAARSQSKTFELQRTLDLLEKTERTANVGGWEIDADTEEVFWSDHLFEILEWPEAEEPPLDAALDVYHEEDRRLIGDAIDRAIERGDPFDVEARFETPSGEVRWLRVQGIPEFRDGELETLRGAAQDITQRKEREGALRESNQRLEQFAYAASHDLQEPLRMVSSYLGLIERRYGEDLNDEATEFLAFAVDGADRMRSMVDGLLQYSRVDAAGADFERVDLDAIVENVRNDLAMHIVESQAEFEVEPLPAVRGDPDQLRQVFQNLFRNAIQYSGEDVPHVSVGAELVGDRWRVAVTDEGIGIDPAEQERVFEVFERLHTHDGGGGSGIGLALCQRIIERHGGSISVDSQPGAGATFSFDLPAWEDRPHVRDDAEQPADERPAS